MTRAVLSPSTASLTDHPGPLDRSGTKHSPRIFLRAIMCLSVLTAIWSPAAFAYRPFDGSDASVTEAGVFELELGVSHLREGAQRSLAVPAISANFGLERDTEIALEGRVNRLLGDTGGRYRTSLEDTALSIKHVFRRGSLQDGTGPSIAGECGVLLPTMHGPSGIGATCAGIMSHRWELAAVHVNAALTRTREQTTNRFLGAIVEGPESLPVRPAVEITTERESNGTHTNSALLGLIWKKSEDLALDLGLRRARTDDQRITELRLGFTWSIPLQKK